jgi:hypothetical protein
MTTETIEKVEATAPAEAQTTEPKKEAETPASLATAEAATAEPKKTETKTDAPAVPAKYELKLPEGSKFDATFTGKVEALAKEKQWSQERAQEYIDERHAWDAEREQAQLQQLSTLNDKTWKDELMADPDIGGQKFEQSGHLAHKGAEWLGGKEFADALKAAKLNHHPQLFRGLVKLGRAGAPDTLANPTHKITNGKQAQERSWYPEMFEKKE